MDSTNSSIGADISLYKPGKYDNQPFITRAFNSGRQILLTEIVFSVTTEGLKD